MKTTLSSKGQIVLPRSLRQAHGWQPGQQFFIRDTADGLLLVAAKPFPPTSLDDVMGCTNYRGPTRTLEEMEAGIARGARQSQ